jgi:hypothetical protein
LGDRILDCVRRSGGWKTYKCATDEDFPFLQKRFFEEYQAWTAVERVDPSKLLNEMPMLHLVAKSMDIPKSELQPAPMARKIEVKRVPEAPTPEQNARPGGRSETGASRLGISTATKEV